MGNMDTLKLLENLIKERDTKEQVVSGLTKEATAYELADNLYSLYMEQKRKEEATPMRITQSDFDKHFRIIGMRSDGEVETRGRKPKVK